MKNEPIKSTSAKKARSPQTTRRRQARFIYTFIVILTIFAAKLFGKLPSSKRSRYLGLPQRNCETR